MLRKIRFPAIVLTGALVGNFASQWLILRAPGKAGGFIDQSPEPGWDDVASAVAILVTVWALDKVVPG